MSIITIDELLEFVLSDYALEENIVYAIDDDGLGHILAAKSDVLKYWGTNTIKVQSMEKYNQAIFSLGKEFARSYGHNGPVTCHAFYAPKGARSFPVHTDPDDVVIYTAEGAKCMHVGLNDEAFYEITPGNHLRISANTHHRADNQYESLMLSFGLERFMKDKAQ